MPYKKKTKTEFTFYIQQGDFKQIIDNLVDPSPTVFESTEVTEVRFNVLLEDQESFLKYHALDHLVNKDITVGLIYDNGIEIKSTFKVSQYERRFGSSKGSIITHVIQGNK